MIKMSPVPRAECGCFPSYYLGSPHTHLGTWCSSSLLAFQSLLLLLLLFMGKQFSVCRIRKKRCRFPFRSALLVVN